MTYFPLVILWWLLLSAHAGQGLCLAGDVALQVNLAGLFLLDHLVVLVVLQAVNFSSNSLIY